MSEDLQKSIALFLQKNEWLRTYYEEVSAVEFYRGVFPEGSFERMGHPEDAKANGVMTVITDGDHAKNYVVFDELNEIHKAAGAQFAIMSPVAYSGRNRTAANARWMYGIAIDLDGVGMPQIRDLFYQMKNGVLPQCTYCINSGHGLHVYYVFEKAVPLYKHLQDDFREFKYELTRKVWNAYTSTYTERNEVQYQGIFQGFRMPSSQTKLGSDYLVTAFHTGNKVTIEYLNTYLMDQSKIVTDFDYKPDLPLHEAKAKYPEWYERRIVQQQPRNRWHIKRDLYDWWLRKLKSYQGVTCGHRYWCLSVLASYAVKCDVDEDELMSDALALVPLFDMMSDTEHATFTKKDALAALSFYQESYVNYSRAEVELVSGIPVPANKRNYQKQADHLEEARAIRDIRAKRKGEAWDAHNGRKPKAAIVQQWRAEHPDGSKAACIRDTGLSKPTVYKWWNPDDPVEAAGSEIDLSAG